jgi:hypothetical protein
MPDGPHFHIRPQNLTRGEWAASNVRFEVAVVFAFCLGFALLVIAFATSTSATNDEIAHLSAGYSYLKWDDYRMNPEHPPLLKKLAALPLLARDNVWPADIELRETDTTVQPPLDSGILIRRCWAKGLDQTDAEWMFGHLFFYGVGKETVQRFYRTSPAVDNPLFIPPTAILSPQDFCNDADNLLFRGRMAIMLLGVALAVLVFLWSREMFGFTGGILSLALFCFDPNFIAHSGLVTTDVGVALFMFGTIYCLWRLSQRLTTLNLVLFLLFFGLTFTAKFSAVLLLPIFWLTLTGWMVFSRVWPVGAGNKTVVTSIVGKMAAAAGLFLAALLVTYAMIWGAYSFRYSAAKDPRQASLAESRILPVRPDKTVVSSIPHRETGHLPVEGAVRAAAASRQIFRDLPPDQIRPTQIRQAEVDALPLGVMGKLILFANRHELLPEAFLYGFAYMQEHSLVRTSFLLGQHSNVGFHSYFFWTFLLKTPLPGLLAMVAGLVVMLRRKTAWALSTAFLIVPVGIYLVVAFASHLNIGHRHLLPVYPFLYVLAGGVALEWQAFQKRAKIVAAIFTLLAIAVSGQIVFYPQNGRRWQVVSPHYLAYFNEFAGGPRNGRVALVDSNLDWGQDLKQLKIWLEKRAETSPIYLCYFGTADPRYYQIAHYNLPGGYKYEPTEEIISPPAGSLIAVSATKLAGEYISAEDWQALKRFVAGSTFVDTVGDSIFIYESHGNASSSSR